MCRSRLIALYCVSTRISPHAAVEAVREREIDDPVDAPKRHRRLGPIARERLEPRALAARQHNRQNVFHRNPCSVGIAYFA